MTDTEIIKALECCSANDCKNCSYDKYKICGVELSKDALELINRQQADIENLHHNIKCEKVHKEKLIEQSKLQRAEIERLQKRSILNGLKVVNKERKQIKSEAIKEFAERLKQEIQENKYRVNDSPYARACNQVADWCIEASNNLVKEMTENITKIEHNSLCETETYKGGEQ